jgi:hypothetical protein
MQGVKIRDQMFTIICDMPCEWKGHMVSGLRINLLVVTKGNDFSTTQWTFSINNMMTNFNNKTMNTFQNMMNMNNVLHLFVNEQDE